MMMEQGRFDFISSLARAKISFSSSFLCVCVLLLFITDMIKEFLSEKSCKQLA